MGGNVKHAYNQRRKRKKRQKRERLVEERENGEWTHIPISASGESYQLWVKTNESDEAVKAYAREFMLREYVSHLKPRTQYNELRNRLTNARWITSVREDMPSEV